jgi:acyl carrier protein
MASATDRDLSAQIENIVLGIHRRNRGSLSKLDFNLPLLAPVLGLDSLDLAEIVVAIERRFGVSPLESPQPPRTWLELQRQLQDALDRPSQRPHAPSPAPTAQAES